ncbi:type ISP restriction/modification enzyme [Arthrobacter sp. H14]|uniref:type ISP restriction/modification enzyme n=1 Tax=Arthrobacter sp. H14 TaxID=1312959 RepID=UPI0012DCBF04|nr:type ISP restriction/modification enzyme [Arthrobacter sp. H14]
MKKPGASPGAKLHYRDIGDYLTREEKLAAVNGSDVGTIDWKAIVPNDDGDWINQRNAAFSDFNTMSAKDAPGSSIFNTHSRGLTSARDAWVYNASNKELIDNVVRMIDAFNQQVASFRSKPRTGAATQVRAEADAFIDLDPRRINWSDGLKVEFIANRPLLFDASAVRTAVYRPFNKQRIYFDRRLNERRSLLPTMFPSTGLENLGFYMTGAGAQKPFSVLMIDSLPDVNLWGSEGGQFLPRYTYINHSEAEQDLLSQLTQQQDPHEGYELVDNVSDWILADYRDSYGEAVTKDDIFYYVYGILHAPDYRNEFAADLRKALPRIPKTDNSHDYASFVTAGRELASLHIGYENAELYPLGETPVGGSVDNPYRVKKMAFGKGKDRTRITFNEHITLSSIPEQAYEYMLGSRSAIEWIMERYQVRIDKASGIVNNPNDWCEEVGDPRYIIDLVKRTVTVSVETIKIVNALPPLSLADSADSANAE